MIKSNLYKETEKILSDHGLGFRNVQYVINRSGYISVSDFTDQAINITYICDDGEDKIDPGLKIIGNAWWLERHRIDGKEQWLYCRRPKIPTLPAVEYTLRTKRESYDSPEE